MMTWLALAFALEVGFLPHGSFMSFEREPEVFEYDGSYYYPISVEQAVLPPIVYTDLSAEVILWGWLFAGGNVKIPMAWDGQTWGFLPRATYYDFRAGVRLGIAELFWRHRCMHPQFAYMYNFLPSEWQEGAFDEIGLRFSAKFGGEGRTKR
jgi:hypothetical protein